MVTTHTNHQFVLPRLARANWTQPHLLNPSSFVHKLPEDPLAGWSLTDVRAMAIDPEPTSRYLAAQSRWNWDVRVQAVLATDPDSAVVMTLLNNVDPGVEACELIIGGPHVMARRELARRNLRTELLALMVKDTDDSVRTMVQATLERRRHNRELLTGK